MKQNKVKSEEEVGIGWKDKTASESREVAVFLDIPNIYMSSKKNDQRYDPSRVMREAGQMGRVTHAFAYTRLSLSNNGMPGWISKYRELGFELKFIFDPNNGSEPKDVDTQLVTDAVETAFTTDVDVFVIASGDGDYVPLVHLLRKMGKATIVIGVSGSVSRFLSAIADKTVFLDESEAVGDSGQGRAERGETEPVMHTERLGMASDDVDEYEKILLAERCFDTSRGNRGGG